MNDVHDPDRALTSALRALAKDDEGRVASHGVEMRLRAEVRAMGAARRARVSWSIGVAAAVLVAATIPVWRLASRGRRPPEVSSLSAAAGAGVASSRREVTTAFLPLLYGDVPVAGAQIVRMAVPRSALASFGLAPSESSFVPDTASTPSAPGDNVVAEVLVGDDGLARAVRFVRATGPAGPTERTGRTEQTR